jgi:hypothetical protein
LGGLAVSGLTQIVPAWDPRHVWWAVPIGLLLLFSVVQKTSKLHSPKRNPLMLPLLAALGMAIFSGSAYLGSERVQGPHGTIIEGMRVSKTELDHINEDTQFLGQRLKGVKSIVYVVDDGDLSILDGKYRSADSYFVDWGAAPSIQNRIINKNPIVVQTPTFGEERIKELARSTGYEVVARNKRLVVLMPVNRASPL